MLLPRVCAFGWENVNAAIRINIETSLMHKHILITLQNYKTSMGKRALGKCFASNIGTSSLLNIIERPTGCNIFYAMNT